MKKALNGVLIIMLLIATMSISASAVDTVAYYFKDMSMSLELPGDFYVLTPDRPYDQAAFDGLGIDGDEVIAENLEKGIYVEAFAPSYAYEIVISKFEDSTTKKTMDFSETDNSDLEDMAAGMVKDYATGGYILKDYKIYEQIGIKFINTHYEYDIKDETVHCLQYYTIMNGQAISITIYSFWGDITHNMEEKMRQIADTVEFDTSVAQKPSDTAHEGAYVPEYYDEEFGVRFNVPKGWVPYYNNADNTDTVAKFINDYGDIMLFNRYDQMKNLTEEEIEDVTRDMLNNDCATPEFIGEMVNENNMQTSFAGYEEFNDVEYFKVYQEEKVEKIGATSLMHIMVYNGVLYEFQYMSCTAFPSYDDYFTLMNSVEYDALKGEKTFLRSLFNLPINTSAELLKRVQIITVIVEALLATVPIAIYRFAIKKEPVSKRKAVGIIAVYWVCFVVFATAIKYMTGTPGVGAFGVLGIAVDFGLLVCGKNKALPQDDDDKIFQEYDSKL